MAWNTKYDNEVRAHYDYESNLFRQMERINTANSPEEKIQRINTLSELVHPYKDDEFKKNLEEIKENFNMDVKKESRKYGSIDEDKLKSKRYKEASAKYKAIMNLIYRKGFLPQHGIKKKKVGKPSDKK